MKNIKTITRENELYSKNTMERLLGITCIDSKIKEILEKTKCPKCNSKNTKMLSLDKYMCNNCNAVYGIF